MFEIMDIRQKPDMLQAAVQSFWKQWGTETSYQTLFVHGSARLL